MEINEQIRLEFQNPRSIAIVVLLVMIVGMVGVLAFKAPTMEITGKMTGIDENGTVHLSNATIDGNLIDNRFNGYYVVLKVKYVKGSTEGYPPPIFGNFRPFENFQVSENLGDGK